MDGIIFALIALCIVILIVSLIYITNTIRHKERMALLEKGKEPDYFKNELYVYGAVKWGLILFFAGIGFLSAFLLNYYMFPGDDSEPLYPSFILMGAGSGLMIFYKFFRKKLS